MTEFRLADDALKAMNSVKSYINIGTEICNDVAHDFMEHNTGDKETKDGINQCEKYLLRILRGEQELHNLKHALEEVKQTGVEENDSLAELLEDKLKETSVDEEALKQHDKVKEFHLKLKAFRNDNIKAGTGSADMEVEMTQEVVNLKCPYTGIEMVNPVRNIHCNHNYDRDGIKQYIKTKRSAKCPVGGCSNERMLDMKDLVENKELKRLIIKKSCQGEVVYRRGEGK